ncbi:unnamed protein product [Rotaria sordida]|uniref:Deleted in lung and esophageal cancer protein 1 Ig-like domain-containing protein n=1 Tax=Rotaria sordida TaxID=392033 RepID=A0A813VTX7_9BILA|nr:unnamed protein product [Rotaria sordida]CAF0884916.1 unnamed protein product [Rotaria sordida]
MEGETAVISSTNIDHKNDVSSPFNSKYPQQQQQQSRPTSTNIRSNIEERHTLPEIPHNPLTATVAHVVSRELGENFLKTPIRPETVKKLVVSGNVDDITHRLYVQHLREIQAKREYQLQKIGHDEQSFLLAHIQAHEDEDTEEKAHLTSLYVDEQTLTRDQVILPRDFLNYNLQRYIKQPAKEETKSKEAIESVKQVIDDEKKLPKLTHLTKKKTLNTLWKDQISVPERDLSRARLKMLDNLTNYQINPRFDGIRQNQLITIGPSYKPPNLLPVFEAVPSEIIFTQYRVGDVHETTLCLRNLSSVARSCRIVPPKTPYFCVSLPQYPSGHSLVATGLSVIYNIKFSPDTLGVFQDEIIVQCSNGTEFPVKLLAKRPPPVLTLPSLVDCGYWLVGGRKMCEFKVRNDGGEGRFAIIPAASWPSVNFKTVARNETVQLPPFELAPPTLDLRPGDTFSLHVSFNPHLPGEFIEEFIMICDNGEILRYKLKGVGQTIQVRLEDIEGGVIDLNELEIRDISAQYSIGFISINPFSYCQKKMTIKNLTNVELPFIWALLEPVLYTREDFSKQTQPIEIERIVSETSQFHVEPSRGIFPPLTTVDFRLIFAPSQIGNFHTVFHLIVPNAPTYPTPSPSANLTGNLSHLANERAPSPDLLPRNAARPSIIPPTSIQIADYTVLRFETRGTCENFKYIFDPFAIIFMDKIYKNLAYRKDFQLTNTSISPLMVNWANMIGEQIINVEPVVAEIPADATCQFTIILTGTKVGQAKVELPFKLDGIDDYGYLHVEADIIGPDIEIDPSTLDFGLIEYGEIIEKIIKIKNLSPIIAKCQIQEVNKDQSKSLISLPNGTDFILKPIEVYEMPIRLLANEEGALLEHLEVIIEDGKTIPVEITAIIQRPSAYISPVELDIGESFLNVPIVRQIELQAINGLPTYFQWGEPTCIDKNQCLIEINPRQGILYHGKQYFIDIIFIAQQCGILNDDWHIPCYIQNAAQPIFLKLNAVMKEMNVEFRYEQNIFQYDEQFTLDFGRVPLGQKSCLELAITNLTDIESGIKAKIEKFKTRPLSVANGRKTQNFEPIDSDIGIDGMDSIKEIPIRVHITGNPIKTYLSTNKNDKSSSLPIVQFGSMLHNSLPIIKQVHMQNVSHIPIRIDWVIYDITEDTTENSKLIELISVIDNNPFDSFISDTTITENNDELMSQTTTSTKIASRGNSAMLAHSSVSIIDDKPTPLIKLYVKPYQGKRSPKTNAIYSISSTTKIVKPREHFYLDITMTPRNCPRKDYPMKCTARIIGILSVSEERQGSPSQGFHRPIYYEHEEQIEFEMHASLEMPSLRVELNDDDCNVNEVEALSFAIPVGDILSLQPNLYNCTKPSSTKSSSRASGKSTSLSNRNCHEIIYTRTLNLLNTRQCTIPFELSISDSSFLSVQPSTLTSLTSQSKVNVQCHFHLSSDLIERFRLINLNKNESLLSKIDETITIEHGRRIHWHEQLSIKFKQNEMEQIIPIDIRLYFPILTVNCDHIDFGTCFLEQTRQKEFIIKNLTCSSSAWSIRKVHANSPDTYEAFRIEPKCGILTTQLNSKDKSVQQVISVYFTARHNQTYECQLSIEGLLGEPPMSIFLTGQGSYDGKYEAILDI